MPPAFRNHLVPTACGTPTPIAASSLDKPAAIPAQNRRRSSRPATGGRPSDTNGARPDRAERRFRSAIAISCVRLLRRPLESTLAVMARLAQEATDRRDLTVLADRGYFSGWEIYACEQGGVVPYIPKPLTSGAKFEGRFGKQDFVYLPGQDAYRCPAGETLAWRFNSDEGGDKMLRHYWTTKCPDCAIKAQCTPGKQRRVKRWEHEGMLDAMQKRLDQVPQAMVLRRQTVEHPFGTIKAWMGATHFLTKRLKRVRTEMSLQVLAYSMKRVVTILGVKPLMEAIKT